MAKWSDEKVADLTRKLADTAIDYKQRCEVLEERLEAALQDADEAEAYAEELEAERDALAEAIDSDHSQQSRRQRMNSEDNPYFLMGAMLGANSGEVTDLRRRIEELEAERDALAEKLAVEALRQIADPISLAQGNVNAEIARATLAEVKGQGDD